MKLQISPKLNVISNTKTFVNYLRKPINLELIFVRKIKKFFRVSFAIANSWNCDLSRNNAILLVYSALWAQWDFIIIQQKYSKLIGYMYIYTMYRDTRLNILSIYFCPTSKFTIYDNEIKIPTCTQRGCMSLMYPNTLFALPSSGP